MKPFFEVRDKWDEVSTQPAFQHRAGVLPFYHDLVFIREIERKKIAVEVAASINRSTVAFVSGQTGFYVKHLEWDSRYFGREIFRLTGVLFDAGEEKRMEAMCLEFAAAFRKKFPGATIHCELPAEDLLLVQGLTAAGMRLVETRAIQYVHPMRGADELHYRDAIASDAPLLGQVAAQMRNPFDRHHADLYADQEQADQYLDTYARACVNGFTDCVIVPDEPGMPSEAFVALNFRKAEWDWNPWKTSQIVLTAVSATGNKGWYKRLVAAAMHRAAREGALSILNTTQIANRAVIHTLENLGFKLGGTRYVLAI